MAFRVCNEKKDVNFTFTSHSVKSEWVNLYNYFNTNLKAIKKTSTHINLIHLLDCSMYHRIFLIVIILPRDIHLTVQALMKRILGWSSAGAVTPG